jgi:hypothetical protein
MGVKSFSEGKTMRRIALTVDALKEMLHEVLGDALEAAPEIGEREGKLVLHWHLLDEGYPSRLEIDPEHDRTPCPLLVFRNFLSLEQSPERPLSEVRHSELCAGINELNYLMEEGHFYYDTHHQPPTVVLVVLIVCADGTITESIVRDYLYRALLLGAWFVPQLSALAQVRISVDEFNQFVHDHESLFREVVEERVRLLMEQQRIVIA